MKPINLKHSCSNTKTSRPYDYSQLWTECMKRGLSSEPLMQTALQQLSINPADIECAQIVLERIRIFDTQEMLNPDPFRPTNPTQQSKVSGPIRLGQVQHSNIPWGIYPAALTEHMVIVGRTGGGKSTIIKAIIRQLLERLTK